MPILRSPKGDEFTLKMENRSIEVENNLLADTATNAVNDLIGTDFELNLRSVTLEISINNMSTSDYPSDFHDPANVTSHNEAYAYELKESAETWGLVDGYKDTAELEWSFGGITETKDVILQSVNMDQIGSVDNDSDQWQATIELIVVDQSFF
jgi:hypothetical protein